MKFMPKKRLPRVMVFTGIISLTIILVGFVYLYLLSPQTRLLWQAGITYYTPSYLPTGVEIKNRQLWINSYKEGGDPFGITITNTRIGMSFRDVDNVYSIDEFPIANYESVNDFMHTDENNYDVASKTPTCKMVKSSDPVYRVCHWYDYDDMYSVYEIKFVKGATGIRVNLNSPDKRILSDGEIDDFVTSFKRGNPNDLHIKTLLGGI